MPEPPSTPHKSGLIFGYIALAGAFGLAITGLFGKLIFEDAQQYRAFASLSLASVTDGMAIKWVIMFVPLFFDRRHTLRGMSKTNTMITKAGLGFLIIFFGSISLLALWAAWLNIVYDGPHNFFQLRLL